MNYYYYYYYKIHTVYQMKENWSIIQESM